MDSLLFNSLDLSTNPFKLARFRRCFVIRKLRRFACESTREFPISDEETIVWNILLTFSASDCCSTPFLSHFLALNVVSLRVLLVTVYCSMECLSTGQA